MPTLKKAKKPDDPFVMGSTIIGERGQVVIPKDIRDRLKLKAGSQLMVMQRDNGPIMLLPVDQMRSFVDEIHKHIASFSDQV